MRIFWAAGVASVVFAGCGGGGGGKTSASVDGDCTGVGAVVAIDEEGEVLCGPVVEDYTAFGACPAGQVMSGVDDGSGEALCVANAEGSVTEVSAGAGLIGGGQGGALSLVVDSSLVQQRVTGTCPATAISTIAIDGTVTCLDAGMLDNTPDSIGDDGLIDSAEIEDGTIVSADLGDGSIASADIALDTITAIDIATDAIGSIEIATGAVGTSEIVDGTITSVDVADGSITSADIGDSSVTSADIAVDTITASDIATGAVGAAEIATSSVGTSEIADNAITSADIGDGQVADVDVRDDVTIDNASLYAPDAGTFAGRVGIGTNVPAAALHIAGDTADINGLLDYRVIRFADDPGGGSGDIGYIAYGVRDGVGEGTNLEIGTSNDSDDHISLMASGSVGIGTRTPQADLHVEGNLFVSNCILDGGGAIGTCSSDARFKKDIRPFDPMLDRVTALEPVRFRWRSDEFPERRFGDAEAYGLIAQQVERVLPELVIDNPDGYKSVAYPRLNLYLLQAIKDEHARVQALEAENTKLSERLDALEARLAGTDGVSRSSLGTFGALGAWATIPLLFVGLALDRRRRANGG